MSDIVKPENAGAVATLPDIGALQAQSEYNDPQGLAKIGAIGFSFLPRLQLFTSNSDEVKRAKIGVAQYGLIIGQDELKVIGKTVVLSPLSYRAKAMDVKSFEKPVAYHRPNSDEFKDIRRRADAVSDSGCMYGPEFLVWIPSEQKFATFFMGSKTARNVAPAVRALQPKPNGSLRAAILDSVFIEANGYSWHGPTVKPSDQGIDPMPPADTVLDIVTNFLNPIDSVAEEKQPDVPVGAAAASADR